MKVLVACEESQAVCKAFRARGHEAYSCDIIDCSGGHPEWHIKQDVLPLINGNCSFLTCDGTLHRIDGEWDLLIAHPPCTRLCNSGQRWLYWGDEEYRRQKQLEKELAIAFFLEFTKAKCSKIAIENPMGIMSTLYRPPDFTYNPHDFEGETECKKTGIWTIGDVPPLRSTRETTLPKEERTNGIWRAHFDGKKMAWNDPETARLRSQTPLGVAKAMAEQWG